MKKFIYDEMMVHVPLCTSKNPQSVLILSSDTEGFECELQKHDKIAFTSLKDIDGLRGAEDASYDVVISELEADAATLAHYNRVLKEDGLLVTIIPSLDEAVEENKRIMEILGKYAKIVMPFHLGCEGVALLASKEYHPTADIILHRADMLDGLKFYNSDIHPASFAMGNYIRKEYLGIIKN